MFFDFLCFGGSYVQVCLIPCTLGAAPTNEFKQRRKHGRSPDQSLLATCTKWSQYEYGTLVTGWTDGRVSFSEASASGGNGSGKGGKTKLVFPSEEGGSVIDLRYGKPSR